MDNQQFWERD